MKILFLSPILPYPENNGASIRIYNILKFLSKKHEIHLVCFGNKNITVDDVEHVKNIVYNLECVLWDPALRTKFYLFKNLFSLKPLRIKRFYNKEMETVIKNKLNNIDFDIVHISMLQMYQYEKLILNKEKIILEEFNIESNIIKGIYKTKKNWIKKLYWFYEYKRLEKYEKKVLKQVKYCIAVSDIDKENLLKFRTENKDKIFVIENGTDTEYFNTISNDLGRSVVFVGSLDDYTNIDSIKYFICKIWPKIIKKVPDIIFCIIGKIEEENYKISFKEKKIKIILNPEDVRPYLKIGTIFVVPLRIGSGTRLKILNAMSMQCAVVSTSLGAEGLDIKNNYNIMIEDDPEIFADKVISLLKNKKQAVKLGMNARELVSKKYDWLKILPKLEMLYSQKK